MPVFLLWPKHVSADEAPRNAGATALSAAAALFVCVAVASGAAAFVQDLRTAFRWAGPSVFTDGDRRQMDAVLRALPRGAPLLVVAGPTGVWSSLLWQRALYPAHEVVVVRQSLTPELLARVRSRWRFWAAVSIGDPPPDPGFGSRRDLGAIPAGVPGRVVFGELVP